MDALHRVHPAHTAPTESDSVPAAEDSIEEPAFHRDVHPDHDLYYITPTSPWKCGACKHDSANIQEKQCYHCELCAFYVCKSCFAGVNSQVHHSHTLYRTDVRPVYSTFNGLWKCDICGGNNGPEHFFPAHCSLCKFDLCDNCMKSYTSTHHDPEHVLYRADSKVTYRQYNGVWFCDHCKLRFSSERAPFHCSQCVFDLCERCMKSGGEVPDAVTSETRAPHYIKMSIKRKPLAAPSDEANQQTGVPGPPDGNMPCPYCLIRPKNAQIVHGGTAHECCCVPCAEDYHARQTGCPVCGAPIDRIIRVFNS